MALGFGVLATTGVMLFLVAHSNRTAAIHTTFAALFVIGAGLHIRNNAHALGVHVVRKRWPTRELALAAAVVGVVLVAGLAQLPGANALYDWGNEWRSQQRNTREGTERFEYLTTKRDGPIALELAVRKGRAFQYPLFAAWIEDDAGRAETLYVSRSVPTDTFSGEPVHRPEALPVWSHRRERAVDAVSAATPVENFQLSTHAAHDRFTLYFEVNQSFDWNDYYSKTRFPDDAIYSGDGQVGQPSVVYAAPIDLSHPGAYYALNPIGHGHHSGQTGEVDRDLSKLSTALEIVDGVLVKVARK